MYTWLQCHRRKVHHLHLNVEFLSTWILVRLIILLYGCRSYIDQRPYGMVIYVCFHIIKIINYCATYPIIHINTSNFSFIMQDLGKMYCIFYKLMSLPDLVILYVMHVDFYYITCL